MAARILYVSLVLLLCFSATLQNERSQHIKPIEIDVFYESKCPDSKKFLRDQLAPTHQKIGQYLDIRLIPYGNADTTGTRNHYRFKCQHGEDECYGNRLQACSIVYMNFDDSLDFINCAFKDYRNQRKSLKACVKSKAMRKKLKHCENSPKGHNLLRNMGKLTPSHSWIPWVVINNESSDKVNEKAINDLMKTLCKRFKHNKPLACRHSSGKKT